MLLTKINSYADSEDYKKIDNLIAENIPFYIENMDEELSTDQQIMINRSIFAVHSNEFENMPQLDIQKKVLTSDGYTKQGAPNYQWEKIKTETGKEYLDYDDLINFNKDSFLNNHLINYILNP